MNTVVEGKSGTKQIDPGHILCYQLQLDQGQTLESCVDPACVCGCLVIGSSIDRANRPTNENTLILVQFQNGKQIRKAMIWDSLSGGAQGRLARSQD